MTYAGGKGGAGVYQQIINQIPPHDVYIECLYGSGTIMRYIRRARVSVAVDLDAQALRDFVPPGVIAMNCDGISYLRGQLDSGRLNERVFIYADPPYLMETRSSKRPLYTYEFGDTGQHEELLDLLMSLPCMVALSGYWSLLYEQRFAMRWRSISFNAQTRSGTTAREWLWMNYPEPVELHDYSFLGGNFREREKITRQKRRWRARLLRMDRLQMYALLSSIAELQGAAGGGKIELIPR